MNQITFLDKCKGIALIFGSFSLLLFGAAALIYSTSPAQADNGPQTTYSTGKYQMEMTSVIDSDDDTTWYILVWNTETGRSKFYYGNRSVKTTKVGADQFQLPSSPL